jgi:hypothetical protein
MVYGGDLSVLMLRGLVDRDNDGALPHCLNHVEVWVSGSCVYAEVWADTEFQAVGDHNLLTRR